MKEEFYKKFTKEQLWKEITLVISCTNLTETDQEILIQMIQELILKQNEGR